MMWTKSNRSMQENKLLLSGSIQNVRQRACHLAYDAEGLDVSSKKFAERKPHKVIAMMKEFSKPRYKVDVLNLKFL